MKYEEGEVLFDWQIEFHNHLESHYDWKMATKDSDESPGFDLLEFEFLRLHKRYREAYENQALSYSGKNMDTVSLDELGKRLVECYKTLALRKIAQQSGNYPVP